MSSPVDVGFEVRVGERDDWLGWPSSLGLWMVCGYLVLFLIRPWEVLVPSLQSLPVERIYAVAMLAIVLLTGRGLSWSMQTVAVSLFACAVGLSSISAWDPEYAWPQFYQYATVVVTYFAMIASCRRLSDISWLIMTYVLTMYVYLAKSMWEFFIHGRHQYAQQVTRLVGIENTFGEPNAVAMSAVLSLPLWYFLWSQRFELFGSLSVVRSWIGQLVLFTYPFAVVLAVGLTNSRAGMIGLAAYVGGIAWYLRRPDRSVRTAIIVVGVLLALWIIAPSEQKDRLRTLWNPDAGPANARASATGRWDGFVAALRMVQDRPITGVGVGNFLPYRVAYIDGIPLVAHNLPGQILGETGWLGGLCFALMVGTTWQIARRMQRRARGINELRSFWQLAVAIQLTLLLAFLFGFSLHNGLRYNWLWVAALASLAWEFLPAFEATVVERESLWEDCSR